MSVTLAPASTAEALEVSDVIATPGQPFTGAVAASLSATPQEFVTRAQYDVVTFGDTLSAGWVSPPIGFAVFPFAPMYHWYATGRSPLSPTVIVTSLPASAAETGCAVIVTGLHAGGGCGVGPGFGVGGCPAPAPLPYTAARASRSHDCRFEPYVSVLKATLEFMIA